MIYFDKKQLDKNLHDIANAIRKQIKTLTRKGLDMYGNPFTEYSESYAQHKAEYQSNGNNVDSMSIDRASVVNLMLTGKMMNNRSFILQYLIKQR